MQNAEVSSIIGEADISNCAAPLAPQLTSALCRETEQPWSIDAERVAAQFAQAYKGAD